MDRLAFGATSHTGLDDEAIWATLYLPTFMVWKPAVGQGGLAPSGVQEPDAPVLIGHVCRSRLDNLAVEVELQSGLTTLRSDDVVYLTHSSETTASGWQMLRALWKRELLGKILDSSTGSGLPECTG